PPVGEASPPRHGRWESQDYRRVDENPPQFSAEAHFDGQDVQGIKVDARTSSGHWIFSIERRTGDLKLLSVFHFQIQGFQQKDSCALETLNLKTSRVGAKPTVQSKA